MFECSLTQLYGEINLLFLPYFSLYLPLSFCQGATKGSLIISAPNTPVTISCFTIVLCIRQTATTYSIKKTYIKTATTYSIKKTYTKKQQPYSVSRQLIDTNTKLTTCTMFLPISKSL